MLKGAGTSLVQEDAFRSFVLFLHTPVGFVEKQNQA